MKESFKAYLFSGGYSEFTLNRLSNAWCPGEIGSNAAV